MEAVLGWYGVVFDVGCVVFDVGCVVIEAEVIEVEDRPRLEDNS